MIQTDHRALLLEHGIKPLYREVLQFDDHRDTRAADYAARGFATLTHTLPVGTLGQRHAVLFVARDAATCEIAAAVEADQRVHATRERLHDRRMGELLGYPQCCVDAFVADPVHDRIRAGERGDEIARMIAHRVSDGATYDHRLNIVFPRYANVLEHLPCGFACAASLALAERALTLLFAHDARLARQYPECFRVDLELDAEGAVVSFYRPEFARRRIALRRSPPPPPLTRIRFA